MHHLGLVIALAVPLVAAAKERVCLVEGKAVDPFVVDVVSKGGPALRVRVAGVPASVRLLEGADPLKPPPPGSPIKVEVRGALLFEGTAPVDKVPIKPRAFFAASNGMLRLAPGAEGLDVHLKGKWLEGDVVMPGARLRGLNFPCDGLTLDPVPPSHERHADSHADVWVPKNATLVLRHGPGDGPSMEIEAKEPEDLELHVVERGGAWMRVKRRWSDGSSITGWAKAADLVRPKGGSGHLTDLPIVASCTRNPEPQGAATLMQATVAAGTSVVADRLFAWATVRGGDTLTVRYKPGERWVELLGVPGLVGAGECADRSTVLDEAWVPRQSVKLPGDTSAPSAVVVPDGGTAKP
jgi:hypothetical protein